MKVYVVTKTQYPCEEGDETTYHIHDVFSKKKKADEEAAKQNKLGYACSYEVEEFTVR